MKTAFAVGLGIGLVLCSLLFVSLGTGGLWGQANAQEKAPSELQALRESLASLRQELEAVKIDVTKAVQVAEGLQSSVKVAQDSANEAMLTLARLQLDVQEAGKAAAAPEKVGARTDRLLSLVGRLNTTVNLFYRDISPSVAFNQDVIEVIQGTNSVLGEVSRSW